MSYTSLHDRLRGPIATALKQELGIKNIHALPRLQKVVLNVGINRSKMEGKEIQEYVVDCLSRMTGQKPVLRTSRLAISNFKIRKGLVVGATVTLRGKQMEAFLDRLVSYVLPRIRDFRGIPTKLDGQGNYALGLREHTVFPEIPNVDVQKSFGLQIQVTMKAKNDEQGRALLKHIGFPFRKTAREAAESTPA
jgi:large subunit ribosomal protein L5